MYLHLIIQLLLVLLLLFSFIVIPYKKKYTFSKLLE